MSSLHSCVSARKRAQGGATPTAILWSTCHPFRCYITRSVQMIHNPIYEHWLHCWSLRTQQTTHILSYQSVESVLQHTDTCCEQTHRSSRCRRYRHFLVRNPCLDHLDQSHFGCRTSRFFLISAPNFPQLIACWAYHRIKHTHLFGVSEFLFAPQRQTSPSSPAQE